MLLLLFFLLQSLSFANPKCGNSAPNEFIQLSVVMESVSLVLDTTKVSYQDGPNCFNAALYAKGYISERTKTDESEFNFFLEKFCQKKTSAPEKGDVLALQSENQFYHGALSLGKGKIFEKLSTWGRNPPKILPIKNAKKVIEERKVSSQYLIKKMSDSKYFNDVEKTKGDLIIYSCPDQKQVIADLEILNLIPGIKKIQDLNKKLEEVIFQKKPPRDWQEKAALLILKTLSEIRVDEVSNKDAKYLAVKLKSLESQIWDFEMYTNSDVFDPAKSKIKNLLDVVERNI